jgi:hypothetical protein
MLPGIHVDSMHLTPTWLRAYGVSVLLAAAFCTILLTFPFPFEALSTRLRWQQIQIPTSLLLSIGDLKF